MSNYTQEKTTHEELEKTEKEESLFWVALPSLLIIVFIIGAVLYYLHNNSDEMVLEYVTEVQAIDEKHSYLENLEKLGRLQKEYYSYDEALFDEFWMYEMTNTLDDLEKAVELFKNLSAPNRVKFHSYLEGSIMNTGLAVNGHVVKLMFVDVGSYQKNDTIGEINEANHYLVKDSIKLRVVYDKELANLISTLPKHGLENEHENQLSDQIN